MFPFSCLSHTSSPVLCARGYVSQSAVTLGCWCELWLEQQRPEESPSNIYKYGNLALYAETICSLSQSSPARGAWLRVIWVNSRINLWQKGKQLCHCKSNLKTIPRLGPWVDLRSGARTFMKNNNNNNRERERCFWKGLRLGWLRWNSSLTLPVNLQRKERGAMTDCLYNLSFFLLKPLSYQV